MKKERPAKKLTLPPSLMRLIGIEIIAAVLLIAISYGVWHTVIVSQEEDNLRTLSKQQSSLQLKAIADFFAEVVKPLDRYSHRMELSNALFVGDIEVISQLQISLKQEIADALSVQFYGINQAQEQYEQGASISFVVLDMINQVEKEQTVFPEIVKYQIDDQWAMNMALPVYRQVHVDNAERELVGTIFIVLAIDRLNEALAKLNPMLGETQLQQQIGRSRKISFLSLGQKGAYQTTTASVDNTHWSLHYTPSDLLFRQAQGPRLWVIMGLIVGGVLLFVLGWFVANVINRKLDVTYISNSMLMRSLKAAKEEDELANPEYHQEDIFDVEVSDEDTSLVTGETSSDNGNEDYNDERTSTQVTVPDGIFRAYDIRGIVGEQLTVELAQTIGQAIASEVLDQDEKAIIVARDGRTHSVELCNALIDGILSTGCDVVDIGLVPTPLMNFATFTYEGTNSGVIVTASHNPKDYNGFKFVVNGRTLVDKDIQSLKTSIIGGNFHVGQGQLRQHKVVQSYIDHIFSDVALAGSIHIVIDAANGVAGEVAPQLFEELGCEVTSLYCDIDGEFPNHDPDPSVEENLQPLINKVKEVDADLGIALDGDGDRLVVVTPTGDIIWPDRLLMLFAKDVVSRNPGCDVLYDVKSTRQLSQVITSYGGRPVIWKTGHSHMKTKMQETGALLAGELSGHIFFKERWFGFDDGLYAAARLLEIITLRDQDIDSAFASFPSLPCTPEIKLPVADERKFKIVDSLINEGDFASGKQTTIDGIRVDFSKGWGLVRASNTSPAITLRFEAETEKGVEQLKDLFKRELKKIDATLPLDF